MDANDLNAVYLALVGHYGCDFPNAILVDAALRYNGTDAENARCRMAAFEAVAEDFHNIGVAANSAAG